MVAQRSFAESPARPITCLNVEDHHHNIADNITHYFGCIEICERERFYRPLDDSIKKSISTELRRVDYLRRTLQKSEAAEDSTLVHDQYHVLYQWRKEHCDNIKKIQRIRRRTYDQPDHYQGRALDDYDADKDLKAYMICFEKGKGVSDDNELCHGSFPNQKLPVHDLLRDAGSPLRRSTGPRIRYFHLPSNNMKWVQV